MRLLAVRHTNRTLEVRSPGLRAILCAGGKPKHAQIIPAMTPRKCINQKS